MKHQFSLTLFLVGMLSIPSAQAIESMDEILSSMEAAESSTMVSTSAKKSPAKKKGGAKKQGKKQKKAPQSTDLSDSTLPELKVVDSASVKPETSDELLYEQLAGEEDDTVNLPSFNVDQTFSFKDDTLTGVNKNAFGGQFPNDKVPIKDDPWKYNLKFTGNITFGGPKKNDWGFKVTVPFSYNDPGDLIKKNLQYLSKPGKPPSNNARRFAAQDSEFGLGDINLKLKRSLGVTKNLRTSFGFLVGFPTAEEYEQGTDSNGDPFEYSLGQRQYRFELDNSLSYKLDKIYTLTLTTALKYGIQEDGNKEDPFQGSIKPGINVMLPHKCIFSLSYNAKYSFRSSSSQQYQHDGKIKISKRIGKCNVGLAYQNPLGLDSYYTHNFDLNCSYNF